MSWHDEDVLEIHPHDAEQRGIGEGDWVGLRSRAGETVLRAQLSERMQPGVGYTTFHHPFSGANVVTTDNSDWATNCPEYKVAAVVADHLTRFWTPAMRRAIIEGQRKRLIDLSPVAARAVEKLLQPPSDA